MRQAEEIEKAWAKADLAANPDPVLYLDTVRTTEFGNAYKRRTFECLKVRQGDHVLDLGCGTGDDVLALAGLTGTSGKAVGIDKNPAMIEEATQRSKGLDLPVSFRVGDACNLPFPDNSFDGCRSDRAVQHMERPDEAICEMARVVRPGRWVVVSEPDWETLALDSSNRSVTRRVVSWISDQGVRHGWIGRQLYPLFRKAGLVNIAVHGDTFVICDFDLADRIWGLRRHAHNAQQAGRISEAELNSWLEEFREANHTGQFFSAIMGIMVCGEKASSLEP
jgi:ubiquinone/menaquinone biosynthesis C-methylase UbiE